MNEIVMEYRRKLASLTPESKRIWDLAHTMMNEMVRSEEAGMRDQWNGCQRHGNASREAENELLELLATPASTARTDWKPIATAPKDGSEVLLRVKMRAGIPGEYLVGHWMPGGHCIEDHPAIDAGWYFWNGCMFDKASEPTHWIELQKIAAPGSAYPTMPTVARLRHVGKG